MALVIAADGQQMLILLNRKACFAICKSIVQAHNGNFSATSRIGEGTTFWVRLPCP